MNVRKGKERVRTLMCQVLALVIGLSSAGSMLEGFALGQPTLKEIVAGKEPATNEEVEQDKSEDTKNSTLPIPDDPFGRGTPHGTVEGFLTAAKEGQYERAAEYLDVRYLPGRIAQIQQPYLARQFEIVLDRALWIDPTDLNIDATGQQEDGLPSYRDSVGHIKVGGKPSIFFSSGCPVKTEYLSGNFPMRPSLKYPGCTRNTDTGTWKISFRIPFSILRSWDRNLAMGRPSDHRHRGLWGGVCRHFLDVPFCPLSTIPFPRSIVTPGERPRTLSSVSPHRESLD